LLNRGKSEKKLKGDLENGPKKNETESCKGCHTISITLKGEVSWENLPLNGRCLEGRTSRKKHRGRRLLHFIGFWMIRVG